MILLWLAAAVGASAVFGAFALMDDAEDPQTTLDDFGGK